MAVKPAVYRRPSLGLENRRQVQLNDEMAEALRDYALAEQVSEAEVLRRALTRFLRIEISSPSGGVTVTSIRHGGEASEGGNNEEGDAG